MYSTYRTVQIVPKTQTYSPAHVPTQEIRQQSDFNNYSQTIQKLLKENEELYQNLLSLQNEKTHLNKIVESQKVQIQLLELKYQNIKKITQEMYDKSNHSGYVIKSNVFESPIKSVQNVSAQQSGNKEQYLEKVEIQNQELENRLKGEWEGSVEKIQKMYGEKLVKLLSEHETKVQQIEQKNQEVLKELKEKNKEEEQSYNEIFQKNNEISKKIVEDLTSQVTTLNEITKQLQRQLEVKESEIQPIAQFNAAPQKDDDQIYIIKDQLKEITHMLKQQQQPGEDVSQQQSPSYGDGNFDITEKIGKMEREIQEYIEEIQNLKEQNKESQQKNCEQLQGYNTLVGQVNKSKEESDSWKAQYYEMKENYDQLHETQVSKEEVEQIKEEKEYFSEQSQKLAKAFQMIKKQYYELHEKHEKLKKETGKIDEEEKEQYEHFDDEEFLEHFLGTKKGMDKKEKENQEEEEWNDMDGEDDSDNQEGKEKEQVKTMEEDQDLPDEEEAYDDDLI